jgi:hypothetical protein
MTDTRAILFRVTDDEYVTIRRLLAQQTHSRSIANFCRSAVNSYILEHATDDDPMLELRRPGPRKAGATD